MTENVPFACAGTRTASRVQKNTEEDTESYTDMNVHRKENVSPVCKQNSQSKFSKAEIERRRKITESLDHRNHH